MGKRWVQGAVAVMCVGGLLAVAVPGASAHTTPLPGDPPPGCGVVYPGQCLVQTRNGHFALSSHSVRAGGTLTGEVSNRCMLNELTPCAINWGELKAAGGKVSGCKTVDVTCTVRIPKKAPSSSYHVINITITNVQGAGYSSDYYAVIGKGAAFIEGKVLNKERQPVPGADLHINGVRGGNNYSTVTGPDGTYGAEVRPGHYRVNPVGRSLSSRFPPKFKPEHLDRIARKDHKATADFTVDVGLVVRLELTATSVPADGFQIVQGKITTTEYGQPKPNVTVALWPKASENPGSAVTSGARANVCGPNGRVWPTGTLSNPAGGPVEVTTDGNGTYTFSIDVGTVPGAFPITAWARDESGQLITHDTADASDEKTVTVSQLGNQPLDQFVSSYNETAKATGLLNSINENPDVIATSFEQLTGTQGAFKGYAYARSNPTSGNGAVLVYPATNPPAIQSNGAVVPDANDLVLQPSEWQGIPGVAISDLGTVLRHGILPGIPTYSGWASGVPGTDWKGGARTLQPLTQSFVYYGWPYPSTTSGACS
jgi:hypothetical protein